MYALCIYFYVCLELGFFSAHAFTFLLAECFQYCLWLWARVQFWASCGEVPSDGGSSLQCFIRNDCRMFPVLFFLASYCFFPLYWGSLFFRGTTRISFSVSSDIWSVIPIPPPINHKLSSWTKMPLLLVWLCLLSKSHSEVPFFQGPQTLFRSTWWMLSGSLVKIYPKTGSSAIALSKSLSLGDSEWLCCVWRL